MMVESAIEVFLADHSAYRGTLDAFDVSALIWWVLDEKRKGEYRDCMWQPMPFLLDRLFQIDGQGEIDKKLPESYVSASVRLANRNSPDVLYIHLPIGVEARTARRGLGYEAPVIQAIREYDGMTDAQGNRLIWYVDSKKERDASEALLEERYENDDFLLPLERALEHPSVIPFFGGEKRVQTFAERYHEGRIPIGSIVTRARHDGSDARFLGVNRNFSGGRPAFVRDTHKGYTLYASVRGRDERLPLDWPQMANKVLTGRINSLF